jgi:hypothetical protein
MAKQQPQRMDVDDAVDAALHRLRDHYPAFVLILPPPIPAGKQESDEKPDVRTHGERYAWWGLLHLAASE